MTEEFANFIWQHQFNRKWINYRYEEHCILNAAVKKRQKSVTLPVTDPIKRLNVNLEKMIQKNLATGFEQRIRCLICNGSYVTWSWQDDFNSFISYTPRLVSYLEVAYAKKLNKIDIFIKADYEIDLKDFTQRNKETNNIRLINREMLNSSEIIKPGFIQLQIIGYDSDKFIKSMCKNNISSVYDVFFDLPFSQSTTVTSSSTSSPLQDSSHHGNIVRALQEDILTSDSNEIHDVRLPVDPECPEADNYHIFSEHGNIYEATLNFTSLQANHNKYFILQLLKNHKNDQYTVWFHWGRTGYKGLHNLINFGSNLNEAKAIFEKKFYDKTHNIWTERRNFRRVVSKYDLVHTDFTTVSRIESLTAVSSCLDPKVQSLLSIICSKKALEDAAKEMSYDSKVTPLGKITSKQVLDGYAALGKIVTIIQRKGSGKELLEACNNFYTKIPHDFKKKTPPILQTMADVKEKLKMLESLTNIGLAMDVINSSTTSEHYFDKCYRNLNCIITPLDHSSDKFLALKKCLLETHGPTHNSYTMELMDAFECCKYTEEKAYTDYDHNVLLWHGSRITNWIGILKNGLQIAPPEAPCTGYMFGKGIYFADVSSKSANYCLATKKKNEGILLLSEVSLGKPLHVHIAEDLSLLPDGFNSVQGQGKMYPAKFETTVLSSSATIPFGPLQIRNLDEDRFKLVYNEYVVYNTSQVKMKYLLRIKLNF